MIMGVDFGDGRTSTAAQRIAKILLEINRKEMPVELTVDINGFRAPAGRNVMLQC